MSLQALSDYTIISRYSKFLPEKKRRETWAEMVDRVFDMHKVKYAEALRNDALKEEVEFAKDFVKKKRVLGAQRLLQFGGEPVFKHPSKVFNCSYGYIDRPAAFGEAMYMLLCGCGVGFSVQTKHIGKLPDIGPRERGKKVFVAEDSIEGWADCVQVLMNSYFLSPSKFPEYRGHEIEFDLSGIRPEGSLIAGQFKAPGPKGLETSLKKIAALIDSRLEVGEKRLRSIDAYDCVMHFSDAVLSGGVRRSATLCLFSKEDGEMLKAKTGDWYIKNPQRGRSNNSVLLIRDTVTKEEFAEIMKSTRMFGEPGFIFSDSEDIGYNPCVEISLYPQTADGRSGWQMCNLTEINGKYCDSEEKFYDCCRASAIIGTLQAGYTNFKYLSKESQEITEKEALLGCSVTGVMDNPAILLDPKTQKKGAEIVKKVNAKIAKLIGINIAARTTCIKPAGSTSCVLSSSSGIHPHHAKRYIRRVQANRNEFAVRHFKEINPLAVEKSVWSSNGTDEVISFLCEVPKGAITKNALSAVDFLEKVKLTQQNWVESGTNLEHCVDKKARHNVSNTITVNENEWDEIEEYIFKNRRWFAGISLLPASGDLDYPQAPFTSVLDEKELVERYGSGALLGSGLIVDGLGSFGNNLWAACDCLNGIGEIIVSVEEPEEPVKPSRKGYKTDKEYSSTLADYAIGLNLFYQAKGVYVVNSQKIDWIRRANQFSVRYFGGDRRKMTHCLKHLYSFKLWLDLTREYKEIDWVTVVENEEEFVSADTLAAQGCAGGKCEFL